MAAGRVDSPQSVGDIHSLRSACIRNPFSDTYQLQNFDRSATDYGRPTSGSKTEARGIKAGVHVCREILYLCELIDKNADGVDPNKYVKFGKLFVIYSYYSDKLVGMLIRARKYGLLHFDGEMLYQRQDDNKEITMLMSYEDIRLRLKPSGDPKNCVVLEGTPPPLPPHLRAAKEAEAEAAKQRKMSGAAGWASIQASKGAPARKTRNTSLPDPNAVAPPPSFCMSFSPVKPV